MTDSFLSLPRVISEHGVRGMFVAPTALRAIKRQDPTAAEGKRHRMKRKAIVGGAKGNLVGNRQTKRMALQIDTTR